MMKNYRRFLLELQEELQSAIGEAENSEWHHQEQWTTQWQHYNRLCTWQSEVTERMVSYAAAKTRSAWRKLRRVPPASPQKGNILGAPDDKHYVDGDGSGQL